MNLPSRNVLALVATAIALVSLPSVRAQKLTFDVNINTAGLSADAANSPFYLDFQLLYGNPSLASNTATLSNFSFTGGGAVGSPVLLGSATGSLGGTVTLTANSSHIDSEFYEQFSSGVTDIDFIATLTETGPDLAPPTEFLTSIMDASLGFPAQLYTTAPDTESLVTVDLSSSNTLANVNAYTAYASADGNTAVNVTPVISSVPDTATTAAEFAVGLGLLALAAWRRTRVRTLAAAGSLGAALSAAPAIHAQGRVQTVWYILMENRNFTENETSGGAQIYGSPAAPYINSLITPGTQNSAQVSYCAAYHNALSVYDGSGPSIHPSEPNYVWMESGSNLSKLDDNDPYGTTQSVAQILNFLAANPAYSGQNVCGLLQAANLTWRAYSEETNNLNTTNGNANLGGTPTANPAPESQWTVPLASFSGTNNAFTNPYNGSHQWNFACKHTGSLFFPATNGTPAGQTTANTSTSNPEAQFYSPLPDLAADLANGTCAQYNVITPDQYNDMHTALSGGFTYNGVHYTGDLAQIAQGDNFLSIVVPQIMASSQYQNGGCIVIWTDETEGSNQNDFRHTLMEIVISPLAKGNAYCSTLNYTHSSDVNTMQKIFQLTANSDSGFLNDAANPSNSTPGYLSGTTTALTATSPLPGQSATPPSGYGTGEAYDLSDLFQPGVIPGSIPTLSISPSGFAFNRRTNTYTQTATVTNMLTSATANTVYLEVGNLPSGATLLNAAGTAPDGKPYVVAAPAGFNAGASTTVTLQFHATGSITDLLSVTTNGTP